MLACHPCHWVLTQYNCDFHSNCEEETSSGWTTLFVSTSVFLWMSHLGGCHDLEIFHVRSPQQTQEYWVLIFLALDQTLAKWTMSDNWGTIEGSYDPMMTWIVECRHIKYNWDPMMWWERKYLHWLAWQQQAASHSGLQFKWVITISNAEEPRASLRPCKSLSSCTPLSWWGPTV